jgi:hypothetical protein
VQRQASLEARALVMEAPALAVGGHRTEMRISLVSCLEAEAAVEEASQTKVGSTVAEELAVTAVAPLCSTPVHLQYRVSSRRTARQVL